MATYTIEIDGDLIIIDTDGELSRFESLDKGDLTDQLVKQNEYTEQEVIDQVMRHTVKNAAK